MSKYKCKWDPQKHNGKPCPFHSGETEKASKLLGVKIDDYISDYEEPNYSELMRETAGDDDYQLAKEILVNNGRGLSRSGEKKELITKAAKPSKRDFLIFRTDDTNWLKDKKVGDEHQMDLYIAGSTDENLVIKENENSVKQRMIIEIKKGTPIIVPNNASEKEVDVVNTGGYRFKITDIDKDKEGVPVYRVEVVK